MLHLRYTLERMPVFEKGSKHYEDYLEAGLDPTDCWDLIYSFFKPEHAFESLAEETSEWKSFAFRVRDTETGEVLALEGI